MNTKTDITAGDQGEDTKQERRGAGATMLPPVDIVEDGTGITLLADLPGVSNETLTVRVEGQNLRIEGELRLNMPEGMEAAYAEIQVPRYRRAFSLSADLDTSKCEAGLKDGVLRVRIPKVERAQPRKIEVKAG
jgi:HSP20 family protein